MADATSRRPEIAALVDRVHALLPLLSDNASAGELERHVLDASFDALRTAGVFRLCVPSRFGGYGANARDSLAVAREIGRGDGAAAWVFGILNSGAWVVSLMSLQAQEEVWGADRDQLVSIVLAATSKAVRVEGGYRVTGKWNYGTGSHHAQWSLLGVPLEDEDGNIVDSALALFPREDISIEETWYVVGMKATGSNTQVVDDVFVPDHRIFPLTAALEGVYPGSGVNPEATYRMAFIPALALQLVGPHLGMGHAVLDYVIEKTATKGIAYTGYERQADAVSVQLAVARAALLLETAELFAFQLADRLFLEAKQGHYASYAERVRMRSHLGFAVDNVTQAIDMLVSVHGAGAFAEASPIQRFWRDQAAAARHAHSLPATGYEVFGKVLLGLEDEARDVLPVL